jgi:hypothetical protein
MAAPTSSDGRLGGTDGNERLTGSTGAALLLLLGIEGLTVISLGSLLSEHIFIGVLLIPPILLKIASTGYRFTRYYRGDREYVSKGPPPLLLRTLGPVIVISAIVLFVTGVALLVMGPGGGGLRGIHKLSFLTAADWRRRTWLPGSGVRRGLLVLTLAAGLGLGAVAIANDGSWVHRHHDHGFADSGR